MVTKKQYFVSILAVILVVSAMFGVVIEDIVDAKQSINVSVLVQDVPVHEGMRLAYDGEVTTVEEVI